MCLWKLYEVNLVEYEYEDYIVNRRILGLHRAWQIDSQDKKTSDSLSSEDVGEILTATYITEFMTIHAMSKWKRTAN